MSTADRFEERAEARGRAQGRAEVLIKQLRLRFRDVPDATEQRVRASSIDELDALAERVLTAQSIDEVFARR